MGRLSSAGRPGRNWLPPAGLLLLLLLFLELLDELVERLDHAVLDLADLGPAAAEVQLLTDVLHPPGDVVQRVGPQRAQVHLHQAGDGHVAARAGLRAVEQIVDRLEPFGPG